MSSSHAGSGGAKRPRVNLLPERQLAELRHRATVPKLWLALLASALVAAALWGIGTLPVLQAEREFAAVTAESEALRAEAEQYGDAQLLLTEIGGRLSDRVTLTETEVLFMALRDDLLRRLPAGSVMTEYAASVPGDEPDAGSEQAETGCVGSGASVALTLTTVGPAGLSAAAGFLAAAERLSGFSCGALIDHRVLLVGDEPMSETTVHLGFDESVRGNRFGDGGTS